MLQKFGVSDLRFPSRFCWGFHSSGTSSSSSTLEQGTYKLCRNAGNQLQTCLTEHPRRAKTSRWRKTRI